MTELETLLLNALKDLKTQLDAQQKLYQQGQNDLETMFKQSVQENRDLRQQLNSLNEQVSSLNRLLQRFSKT